MATDTRANFWAMLRADSSQAVSEFGKVSKAADGVTKTSGTLESRFSSTMKKLAVATGVGFGTAAMINYGRTAVTAAARLEQSVGGTEAVFKGSEQVINQWAESAAKNMGLSEAAARESLSLIGAQLKNFGYSVQEAQTQGQGLVQFAADLAATFGGPTTDAVTAITAALRGERDPIERYGISLNDATVKAKALAMGLYDGTGDITMNAKATASLALIYEQAGSAAGQFAREADTLSGKMAIGAAQSENAAASLGEALAPAYAVAVDLATKFSEAVVKVAGSEQVAADGLGTYMAEAKKATTTNGGLLHSFELLVDEVEESRSIGEKVGNTWNAAWGGLTDANSDSEALRNLDRFREAWHLLVNEDPAEAQRLLSVLQDLKAAAEAGNPAAKQYFDTYAIGADEMAELSDDLMGYRIATEVLGSTEVTATMAARDHYDALGELNAQYEDVEDSVSDTELAIRSLSDYMDGLDDLKAGLQLEQQFIDLEKAADEAWYATASGADDAREKQIDYQLELIGTQEEVRAYLEEVLKLPADKVTDILADIDEGSIYNAETFLNAVARARSAYIYVTPIMNHTEQPDLGSNYWDTHADGGLASGWSMVGERGPELVNFSQPGRVYSNVDSSRMLGGGGGGVTVVNNGIMTGSPAEIGAAIMDCLEAAGKDGRRMSIPVAA